MKIVDVAEFYSERGGGVRTYVRQKLAAGARAGHDVLIIAPGAADAEETVDGGSIRWVRSAPEKLDSRYFRFVDPQPVHDILDREQPDVVESSSPWRGARIVGSWQGNALKALVLHNDPVAVYAHSFLDRFMEPDRLDRLCRPFWAHLAKIRAPFTTCIVAGDWLARRLSGFGITATAVPFGIDKTPFRPDLRDEQLRREMLRACEIEDEAATLFVAVSRHHPEKRLSVLIDAMSRIGHRRPAGLFLIGDGPLRGWVERIAAQVRGVHVAGALDRAVLPRFLASADAFIHAGAAETFGLAIAEALCTGLPMVLPDRGGAAALAHPSFAETYAAGDATACADAALRLVARDRAALSAAAARAGVERIRSDTAHFSHLFDHYRALRAGLVAPAVAA
jgi:alpha-1,6-mannosyltransferase